MNIQAPGHPNPGLDRSYGPFIGGEFLDAGERTFPAVNPATGRHLADIARCGPREIDLAVKAARGAFKSWSTTGYEHRSTLLLKLADALEADLPRLAMIDALDIGRRVSETEVDYRIAIGQYRYFAAAILNFEDFGKPIPNGYSIARRQAIGVCGIIIPWNAPSIMAALKLAPALAAGNTVVLKPDENASLSTLELCKHIANIFPPGVVNVVPGLGEEAGGALTAHPDVAKLAFTGSSEVGRIISAAAAARLVPVTLELGGKSPNIVFPDVQDLDAVVDNAAFAGTYCNGQSCLAGTRLFVHDHIYNAFMDKLVAGLSSLNIGSPIDATTKLSCLVSKTQGERVLDYIDIGGKEGANLVTGGHRQTIAGNEHGYFIQPTVFEANNSMRIAQEEIFGPVLSVIRWNDYETMLEEANGVRYGLASGIYTADLAKALKTAERLEVGAVWINQYFNILNGAPLGGWKDSGFGSEYCRETLNLYTHLKSVTMAYDLPQQWYLK
ncbi:MAG: aldehyde dehydrogenase [Devosia sp.]|uniref:aldehyde dehydrogenase family protein n=1 Tax=Devosia sp. TaxID=1871048 RepID=UPI00260E8D7D|nr:aldehyde dehydrogenase family protein [Devosia sp.]MDB5526987.1 aldehyde dehydrogenase [Devosia sp.]